jgi:Ca-activated chloride channel family protein
LLLGALLAVSPSACGGGGARPIGNQPGPAAKAPIGAGQPLTPRPMHTTKLPAAPAGVRRQPWAERRNEDRHDLNTEAYDRIVDSAFQAVSQNPLSTFAVDVDTASYANVRRFLREGRLPPPDAVRIEELVNYFRYDYPDPIGEHPISVTTEVGPCPWNSRHHVVRIGLQGRRIHPAELPPRNLVFLIDVSGSMNDPRKLPLVQQGLDLLIEQLRDQDSVAIVTYAGSTGVHLTATPGSHKTLIRDAVHHLQAAGSTNGGAGIQLAYRIAQESLQPGGVNRVILATDGDFNVGVTSQGELLRLIEEKRRSGVFLTILGFGIGNLKDSTLEKLADHGNGHYAYIDSLDEARKVFVEDGAALVTIAKDVKIQVEFNPRQVAAYRLIGYENRLLQEQDFNDDQKDAGDIGAGHSVTALYEIVPCAAPADVPVVDELKYQKQRELSDAAGSGEWLTLKVRYKDPAGETSKLLSVPVEGPASANAPPSADFRFAAAVAQFGLLLRDSPHKANASFASARELARAGRGRDVGGHRGEFLQLVQEAERLKPAAPSQRTGDNQAARVGVQ